MLNATVGINGLIMPLYVETRDPLDIKVYYLYVYFSDSRSTLFFVAAKLQAMRKKRYENNYLAHKESNIRICCLSQHNFRPLEKDRIIII